MDGYMARVNQLIAQLRGLGYHTYQINNIIKDTVNSDRIEDLTMAESERLVSALQNYIEFAKKSQTL